MEFDDDDDEYLNCESPIEHIFAMNALKYLHEDAKLDDQVKAPTAWGNFRMDFVIRRGERAIGVECDGSEFHQDEWRDEVRDALIVGTGHVEKILRISGSSLYSHTANTFFDLTHRHPYFFSDRSREITQRLFWNTLDDGHTPLHELHEWWGRIMQRAKPEQPPKIEHWRSIYARAQKFPGMKLDELATAIIRPLPRFGQREEP